MARQIYVGQRLSIHSQTHMPNRLLYLDYYLGVRVKYKKIREYLYWRWLQLS